MEDLSHPHFHPILTLFSAMGLPAIADIIKPTQILIRSAPQNLSKTLPGLQKIDASCVQHTWEPSVMMEGGEEVENSKAGKTKGW